MVIRGRVFSGTGVGRAFVSLKWVEDQIASKLGFAPYPGTLNLRIDDRMSDRLKGLLERHRGITIEPIDSSFYPGRCFRARIGDRVEGALVLPLVPNYPSDQIEIIAPFCLRKLLGLRDGQELSIEIIGD